MYDAVCVTACSALSTVLQERRFAFTPPSSPPCPFCWRFSGAQLVHGSPDFRFKRCPQVVESGCDIRVRSALNAAMGGQRLLWQASEYSALGDAIADCAYSIAFGRWVEGERKLIEPCMRWACI